MDSTAREFFEQLLLAPGVSGYEQSVQDVVRRYAEDFADQVETDVHGNVIMRGGPVDGPRVMYAGHADQLGLVVSHIEERGFLYFQTVGGWDAQQLVGQRVSVWTLDGRVDGIVARKAIHLLDPEERKKVVDVKDLWIDIGAADRDEAASVIRIGDSVTLQLGMQTLRNGLVNAPAIDDRAGVWVVVEALRRAMERGLSCTLFAVSTVQEEIGHRGAKTSAYGVDPQVAIAVDVTHATDCPSIDQRQRGSVKLGHGPVILRGPNVNPRVGERLLTLASEGDIPHQVAALGRAAPNDSNALQVSRAGVATGLVQIPNRYMHSPVETVALSDLEQSAELLTAFACNVDADSTFVP